MGCVCEFCVEHVPNSADACAFCARHCVSRGRGPDGRTMWFATPANYRKAAHAAHAQTRLGRLPIPTEAELRRQAAHVAVETLTPLVERGVNTLWDAARKQLRRLGRR